MTRTWPTSTRFGQHLPMTHIGQISTNIWPTTTKVGRHLLEVGPVLTEFVQVWPMLAHVSLNSANLGQCLAQILVNFWNTTPTVCLCLPIFAKLGCFGRCCPNSVQSPAKAGDRDIGFIFGHHRGARTYLVVGTRALRPKWAQKAQAGSSRRGVPRPGPQPQPRSDAAAPPAHRQEV